MTVAAVNEPAAPGAVPPAHRSGPSGALPAADARRIARVCQQVAAGRPVHRRLGEAGGMLRVERRLPFLCVYRRREAIDPETDLPVADAGTERLVTSEAAWLAAASDAEATEAVRGLAACVAPGGRPFLLIEVWCRRRATEGSGLGGERARFRVQHAGGAPAAAAAAELARSLADFSRPSGEVAALPPAIEVLEVAAVAPPGRPPLVDPDSADPDDPNDVGGAIHQLGIEVEPVYRARDSEVLYPLVLEALRRCFAEAVRRAVHVFLAAAEALDTPSHFQALGPAAVDRAALEADARLAEVSTSLEFLLHVTPTNMTEAWREFAACGFERAPAFHYRPLAHDPSALKRAIFAAPVDRVDDPTIGDVLREKQEELDTKISMLRDRGTANFLRGSLQVYGEPSDELVELAERLLYRLGRPPREEDDETGVATDARDEAAEAVAADDPRSGAPLDAAAFARRAAEEIERYRAADGAFPATVEVRNDVPPSLMVSGDRLLVGVGTRIPRRRVEALIEHEVGTHLVTRHNGSRQPLKLLACGLAGYDVLQEGLAVVSELLVGGLDRGRLRTLAGRVLAVRCRIEGAGFVDAFRRLRDRFGFAEHAAFTVVARVFRSGGLTKDAVYLRGLVDLVGYLAADGDLDPLLVGKVDLPHVPAVRELRERGLLRPPVLVPHYLQKPAALARLARLRQTEDILEALGEPA